jgi:hypothetical protein
VSVIRRTYMKRIALRVIAAAIPVALIAGWHLHRGQLVHAQEPHKAVTVTRLYTGADGQTHAEQVDLKFSPVSGAPVTVEESDRVKAANSYAVRVPPGFFESWHNADVRRYVVPISGKAEIEVAGGEKVIIEPGRIGLAEDLTGKGHTFRVIGNEDWVALFVDFAK